METLINSPGLTAGCLFCVWPIGMFIGGMQFGRAVEKYGWPVVKWARPRDGETGEAGL